jgi:hypothetical protein
MTSRAIWLNVLALGLGAVADSTIELKAISGIPNDFPYFLFKLFIYLIYGWAVIVLALLISYFVMRGHE